MKYYLALFLVLVAASAVFAARISGTVTDTSGTPIEGFEVKLEGILITPRPAVFDTTDSNGVFAFDGVLPGEPSALFLVSLSCSTTYTPPTYVLEIKTLIDNMSGCDFVIEDSLVGTALVGGNVCYQSGEPVVGTDIFIVKVRDIFAMPCWPTVTDSAGNYCGLVSAGDTFGVGSSMYGTDYDFPESYEFWFSPGDTSLIYNFIYADSNTWPGYKVNVDVVDTNDERLAGALVQCRYDSVGAPWLSLYTNETSWGINNVDFPVDSGRYLLRATVNGFSCTPEEDTVEMSEYNNWQNVRFVFSSPYWIYAYAEDSIGAPVESLYVQWRKIAGGGSGWMWTGSDGYGVVQVMDSGSYFLGVSYGDPDMMIIPPCDTTQLTASAPVDTVIFRIIPDTTGIVENKLPDELGITAYPNPFNSAVTLEFCGVGATYRSPGQIAVEIYDIHGRLVYAPSPSAPLPKGEGGSKNRMRTFIWQPDESVTSGVYLVRARVGDQTTMKRVVYLK